MHKIQLISIWEGNHSENSYVNFHSHKYHELVYYPSGCGETQIGNRSFLFSKNRFALIERKTEHNETHHTNSQVICLEFSGVNDLPFGFYSDDSNKVQNILKELLKEAKKQKFGYEDMLELKLNELLIHIYRNHFKQVGTKNFDYIINYLRENFHERVNLKDCAKQLNISYDYFQHKFKLLTGLSPQQFLIEQRLEASKKLLSESLYSCTEIAYRCGFCTSAQFSSLFKKRYGVTPLQYKKTAN